MSSNKKTVVLTIILIICVLLFVSCSRKTPSKEWEEFLSGLVKKYDFIDGYEVGSGSRRTVKIRFYLNEKKSVRDLKEVFKELKLFLEDEENLSTLNEYHKSSAYVNSSGFNDIFVFFKYDDFKQEEGKGRVAFKSDAYSRSRENPETNLDNITFDDWIISVNYEHYKYDSPELDNLP